MEEKLIELGLGGAGFFVLFLIVKMLLKFINEQRKDHAVVLGKLTNSIDSLKDQSEKTAIAMQSIAAAVQQHHDFVKMYTSMRNTAGGGNDDDTTT